MIFILNNGLAQQTYKSLNGRISFSSQKGMNLLEAFSENLYVKFEPHSQKINLKVQVTSFNFTNCSKLVEKTFNDIYMESHKYHWAKFEGRIIDTLNLKIVGSKNVAVEGILTIHGVQQSKKVNGTMAVNADNSILLRTKFNVLLSDFQIIVLNEDIDRLANTIEIEVFADVKSEK
ncbi:MAG: YceI family protein [Cytophagales bacterium]